MPGHRRSCGNWSGKPRRGCGRRRRRSGKWKRTDGADCRSSGTQIDLGSGTIRGRNWRRPPRCHGLAHRWSCTRHSMTDRRPRRHLVHHPRAPPRQYQPLRCRLQLAHPKQPRGLVCRRPLRTRRHRLLRPGRRLLLRRLLLLQRSRLRRPRLRRHLPRGQGPASQLPSPLPERALQGPVRRHSRRMLGPPRRGLKPVLPSRQRPRRDPFQGIGSILRRSPAGSQ